MHRVAPVLEGQLPGVIVRCASDIEIWRVMTAAVGALQQAGLHFEAGLVQGKHPQQQPQLP